MRRLGSLSTTALLWGMLASGRAGAADFVRGDANSDGQVTAADAQKLIVFLFLGGEPPPCLDSGDANDDGQIDISDEVWVLSFLYLGKPGTLAAPYPEAGPDPAANAGGSDPLDCLSYGGVPPIDDPLARLEVRSAAAPGGDSARAVLTVAVTSSRPLAGCSGTLRVAGDPIAGAETRGPDLVGNPDRFGFRFAGLRGQALSFAYLASLSGAERVEAEEDVAVLEILLCLREGTAAGEYAMTLEAGELADFESGRAVRPALGAGTLTVGAAVAVAPACGGGPGDPPDDPSDPPETVNAVFRIGDASAAPGAEVAVPFIIRADGEVQGYSVSVDFDEEVLEALRIEEAWEKPDGSAYGFHIYELNNQNVSPGNAGVDEGYLIGAAVFDLLKPVAMPANTDNVALRFHFRVRPEPGVEHTEVRFLDGGKGKGQPVKNVLTAYGRTYTPDQAASFIFLSGQISVLEDIATFIRGDSNGDRTVDLSDAQTTLAFLFLGGAPPRCFDAADFNDDGAINITDPIATLGYVYLGGTRPPEPAGAEGVDPTPDVMGCLFRT